MPDYLYHGPSDAPLGDIIDEGISGPSYWGTESSCSDYATSDGKVFRVPIARFDPSDLMFNDLLAQAMIDNGDDVPADGTWEDSLREFDSVRYEGTMFVTEDDLVDLKELQETMSPAP